MRIEVPKFDDKKSLFAHLVENKSKYISEKKSMQITSQGVKHFIVSEGKAKYAAKAEEGSNGLIVDVVANMANWFDSHQDVMLPDWFQKSVNDKGNKFYALKDHGRSVSDIVAKTLKVYGQNLNISDFGYESDVLQAQGLVFQIQPDVKLDSKVYELYKQGLIWQHSIGLQYVKLDLAINDPEMEEEYRVWQKYYGQIINKVDVNNFGYFWAIKEAKLFENSAVLFASNEMTPILTISNQSKSLDNVEPSNDTQESKPVERKTNNSFIHLLANSNEEFQRVSGK